MNTRTPFFGANWKMHKTLSQAEDFFLKAHQLQWPQTAETVIFTPAHLLLALSAKTALSLKLGAQNFFYEAQGAYTGEISAWMLAQEQIGYAIVGHSERRQIFKEDLKLIAQKVKTGLETGLSVVFCVGETLLEREENVHFKQVTLQLHSALKELTLTDTQKLIVAYEPVWAIGTGKTATPEQAQEMHAFIRQSLSEIFGKKAHQIRIIYGGSMKPENALQLMGQPDIDGGLIGGASLEAHSFHQIVTCR